MDDAACPICELPGDLRTMTCCQQRVCASCWDQWHAVCATCMFCRTPVVQVVVHRAGAAPDCAPACCDRALSACCGTGLCMLLSVILVYFMATTTRD